jgi:patatin-related protein
VPSDHSDRGSEPQPGTGNGFSVAGDDGANGQGTVQNLRHRLDDGADLEDLRIAVTMSGGVSLAVWIGGVACEINRLTGSAPTEAAEDPYAALLDITGSTARVDVISGTSAGGLNGAFLALATVYGSSLGPVGDLWADKGTFIKLLRPATTSNPPSLLQGDEYFLPELIDAFAKVRSQGCGLRSAADRPVDLLITTSLMNGEPRTTTDAFGTEIHEVDHLGLFRFRRGAGTAPESDPFTDAAVTRQLGLAARSTASFPFAFEASYVPVDTDHASLERPAMDGIVNFTRSGFVLDGGVLVNRPVGLALQAIFEQPASRQVRRAMAYIDPNPAGPPDHQHQKLEDAPTVREVMTDSLLTLPRAQSIAKELEELERRNVEVADRRGVRLRLGELASGLAGGQQEMAEALYQAYRERRIARALNNVLRLARQVGKIDGAPAVSTAAGLPVPGWSRAEFAVAFEQLAEQEQLAFIPPQGSLTAAQPNVAAEWRFGLATVERLAFLLLDVFQRAIWVAPLTSHDLRAGLRLRRQQLHEVCQPIGGYRTEDTAFWTKQLRDLDPPPETSSERNEQLRAALAQMAAAWPLVGGGDAACAKTAWKLVRMLREARPLLLRAVDEAASSTVPGIKQEAKDLQRLLDETLPAGDPTDETAATEAIMRRLIALEVLHLLFAPPTDVEQSVELMQISGWTPNSFDGPSSPATKLAGSKLGHFGAFYKRSWRVNDWIWGRLDGATRLCQLTLSPDRLRQLNYPVAEAVDAIRAAALGPDPVGGRPDPDRQWLEQRFDAAACAQELAYLDDPDLPVPPSLPNCAMMIARRVHLQILRGELPKLVAAVRIDQDDGALHQSRGAELRAKYEAAAGTPDSTAAIPPATLVDMFADCGLGQETVAEDAGSDLFASTVSQASLVTASVLDAPTSGLGPARAVARSLRGFLLILYALVAGSVRGGAARFAVALALSTGGALLALGLLLDTIPALVPNLGVALVLGGVALAALRSQVWSFALFVGLPLIAVVVVIGATTAWVDVVTNLSSIAAVGGLAVLSLAVGSLRMRQRPPWPVDGPGGRFRRVALPWVAAFVAGVLLWQVGRLWPGTPSVIDFEFAFTRERAEDLLSGWDRDQFDAAVNSTYLDFAALLVYWLPIAAWNGWIARRLLGRGWRGRRAVTWARRAVVASSLALTASVLDAVENLGILVLLHTGRTAQPIGSLAGVPAIVPAGMSVAAVFKFLFLAIAVLYALVWTLLLAIESVSGRRERRRAG